MGVSDSKLNWSCLFFGSLVNLVSSKTRILFFFDIESMWVSEGQVGRSKYCQKEKQSIKKVLHQNMKRVISQGRWGDRRPPIGQAIARLDDLI